MVIDNMITDPAELSFLVTAGGADVPVQPATPIVVPFMGAAGVHFFAGGEPVTLRSIRPLFPYQFGWGAQVAHVVSILFRLPGGILQVIPELGGPIGSSSIRMANLCDVMDLNLNIRPPADYSTTWELVLALQNAVVSMLNVPTALNGQTLNPSYMLTVEHTTKLT